jgi:O-antigen/teichoic acid export membrane protein
MSSQSLTKQASLLMAGRFLSMPFAFLVPIVLARTFSQEEFGYYKQLFLVFNVLLPFIDFGITNSLYYFMPRFPESKNTFVGQTIILTIILCLFAMACFFFFPNEIAQIFTKENKIGQFVTLLGIFIICWHLSNLLEVVLIIEKRAFAAGIVTFLSESVRSIVSIVVVLLGYGLKELLVALVAVALFRCSFMAYYLLSRYDIQWGIQRDSITRQLAYSASFGAAVIISGLVGNVHLYIVSLTSTATEFAIFAVGCFQLPLLLVVVDSIAKTSLVRMAELRNHENALEEIARVISNSCRKLWLIFFPIFVFLFVVADEFIELLFTAQYLPSVNIFRIFIFMIPISAILIQHVLRAFGDTKFILANNGFCLFCSIYLCWLGKSTFGLPGVALGVIFAQINWKLIFLFRCKKILHVKLSKLIPLNTLVKPTFLIVALGILSFLMKPIIPDNNLEALLIIFTFFFLACATIYWIFNFLLPSERKMLISVQNRIINQLKFNRKLNKKF